MKECNVYENKHMAEIFGDTLRPGGFGLTEKSVSLCGLGPVDLVLDLGCGKGATVGYLYEKYGIKAIGLDPSKKLLGLARDEYGFADFVRGTGESIPFPQGAFSAVFAECTLSLMQDLDGVLKEVYRVLKKGGNFIITDVYAKNPDRCDELKSFTFNSCMRGLHDIKHLESRLRDLGFSIEYFEERSDVLKSLMVRIVFNYGSMDMFWQRVTGCCPGSDRFQDILRALRPGYFHMIAMKGVMKNG